MPLAFTATPLEVNYRRRYIKTKQAEVPRECHEHSRGPGGGAGGGRVQVVEEEGQVEEGEVSYHTLPFITPITFIRHRASEPRGCGLCLNWAFT